ncbi:nucleotide sugar dehydrogenase [Halotia wernerae UHCC 0503]|nr:nucleotide sugar dehydrogenase [Halotia wernerae UHCC 0503]
MKKKAIAVIGLWHLGCVTAACLAETFDTVIGFDLDEKRISGLSRGEAPIFEPDLNPLIKKGIDSGHLTFTTRLNDISEAEYLWITIDTPIDENDECDLSSFLYLFQMLSDANVSHKYIISSQVPAGTCEKLVEYIHPEKKPKIAYIPENLQLGKAIIKFKYPDMIVVGSDDSMYAGEISDLLSFFPEQPIICSIRTSELVKHAINSFLATCISFSNEFSELAISINADAYKIVEIMKRDQRIGEKLPLFPGPWFSGGTLARDIRSLQMIGRAVDLETRLLNSVIAVNESRLDNLLKRIEKYILLEHSCVALLGLVYTEGTDTLRKSPGLQLINRLKQYRVDINVFEPMIDASQIANNHLKVFDSAITASKNVDVVIILRAGCMKNINILDISEVMRGRVVFDIWATFSKEQIEMTDLIYIKPGSKI